MALHLRTLAESIKTAGKSAFALAGQLVAPPCCRHCGCSLLGHDNAFLCPACFATVKWIGEGVCRGCGFPAGPYASPGNSCRHCRNLDLGLTAVAAVARYGGAARDLVMALKFAKETSLADSMAAAMALRCRACGFPDIDLVMPVPLHPARLRQRGYNQSALLASRAASALNAAFDSNSLKKVRHTKPQSTLDREERWSNVCNAFVADGDFAGRKILLVDDIFTTGATLGGCAKACRAQGAARVYGLVFAR